MKKLLAMMQMQKGETPRQFAERMWKIMGPKIEEREGKKQGKLQKPKKSYIPGMPIPPSLQAKYLKETFGLTDKEIEELEIKHQRRKLNQHK
jgi:hypothetical protein